MIDVSVKFARVRFALLKDESFKEEDRHFEGGYAVKKINGLFDEQITGGFLGIILKADYFPKGEASSLKINLFLNGRCDLNGFSLWKSPWHLVKGVSLHMTKELLKSLVSQKRH